MTEFLIAFLPWVISVGKIFGGVLKGNMHKLAWAFSIGLQVVWVVWAILSRNWGFLPASAAMLVVNIRNHRKWMREL